MNKEMREKREEFEKIFHVEFKEPQKLESCGKEALTQLINQANKKEAISGIPSGFTKLDDITGGFQGGDLTIIAGRPMMGKTSLALSMARQMAVDHHIPVLFATFEMKETVVSKRLIAAQCDVPLHSMVCAIVNPDQWKDIDKKVAPLVESPITIADIYEYGLEQLELMCRKTVEKDHVKAIFIDSLEFIYSDDYFSRSYAHTYKIIRTFKVLARELDIPIFITSNLKNVPRDFDTLNCRPKLCDLLDDGVVENFSDKILLLHRPEFYHFYQDEYGRDMRGVAILQVEKNKGGYRGDIFLNFKEECGKFTNYDPFNPMPLGEGGIVNSKANEK